MVGSARMSRSERAVQISLTVIVFLICSAWASMQPMGLCPDESMRYAVPLFIFDNMALPNGWDEAIRNPIWGTSYGFSVYGSSLVAAFFMSITGVFTDSPDVILFSARLTSSFFAAGTVYVSFSLGQELFFKPQSKVLFSVLVGFLPQFLFLGSYFNSDSMGIFATALVLLFLLRGVRYGWRMRECVALGIAVGVLALSYYYDYGVIVAAVIGFTLSWLWLAPAKGQGRMKCVYPLRAFMVVLLVALVVAGWFFVRNAILYNGDFIGMPTSGKSSELFAADGFRPSERLTMKSQGVGILSLLFEEHLGTVWLVFTVKSFIGVFGYMSIPLNRPIYLTYLIVLVIGLGSFLLLLARGGFKSKRNKLILITLCVTAVIPIILSIYYSWASDYQAQGRYLMGALLPLMAFVTYGYEYIQVTIDSNRKTTAKEKALIQAERGLSKNSLLWGVVVVWVGLFVVVFALFIEPQCWTGFMDLVG